MKDPTRQVRVLNYNVKQGFPDDPSAQGAYERILKAARPDVIAFQEIKADLCGGDAAAIARALKSRLEEILPGQTWTVWVGKAGGYGRNAIAARFALSTQRTDTTPASDIRGVTSALIDLPDGSFGSADLYLMCVHLKANDDTDPLGSLARRQKHADAIANWILDARTPPSEKGPWKDEINLPANTPILVAGDFNTNPPDRMERGKLHPVKTLLQGDILDRDTYGCAAMPDWDGTALADALPQDPQTGNCYTWNSMSRPSRRYNRFLYTDSVLRVVHNVILDTRTMPPDALRKAGLQPGDTAAASEHLPSFVDFELAPDPPVRPVAARIAPVAALADTAATAGAAVLADASVTATLISAKLASQKTSGSVTGHDVDTGPSLPCAAPTPPITK